MNKIHLIEWRHSGRSGTYCGMEGWPHRAGEYDTADGRRFEAVEPPAAPGTYNCKRCFSSRNSIMRRR